MYWMYCQVTPLVSAEGLQIEALSKSSLQCFSDVSAAHLVADGSHHVLIRHVFEDARVCLDIVARCLLQPAQPHSTCHMCRMA
jgi:hypothetical protein